MVPDNRSILLFSKVITEVILYDSVYRGLIITVWKVSVYLYLKSSRRQTLIVVVTRRVIMSIILDLDEKEFI